MEGKHVEFLVEFPFARSNSGYAAPRGGGMLEVEALTVSGDGMETTTLGVNNLVRKGFVIGTDGTGTGEPILVHSTLSSHSR